MLQTGAALEHAATRSIDLGDLSATDWQDLYRMAWVQVLGVLDDWLHQEIIGRTVEIIGDSSRNRPAKLRGYQISFEISEAMLGIPPCEIMESVLTEQLGFRTFQAPDKIGDALCLVTDKKHGQIWTEAAALLGSAWTAQTAKERQQEIYNRRNKIAHELDIDPADGLRRSISRAEIEEVIQWVQDLAGALRSVIS
jgi:hypothetical protein